MHTRNDGLVVLCHVVGRVRSAVASAIICGACEGVPSIPDAGGDARCLTADPTSSSNGMYCLSGHDHFCCGDTGYPLVCANGSWVCPEATVLSLECMTNCFGDAGSGDSGTPGD